jgi:hypothetical protein
MLILKGDYEGEISFRKVALTFGCWTHTVRVKEGYLYKPGVRLKNDLLSGQVV